MNRTLVAIVAVAALVVACAPASKTTATPGSGAPQGTERSVSGATSANLSVAEIYAGKDSLVGTVVNVRGKVVKFSAQIMGKNWAHIQDGTGAAGTNDLTVTTMHSAKVGDSVLVSGKITLDKDFGSGYKYALIIEDARITVEP